MGSSAEAEAAVAGRGTLTLGGGACGQEGERLVAGQRKEGAGL